jgi:hypothetical protein
MGEPASLVRQYLLYFILPLWILAGLTDYLLHRRTYIEHTSGTKESLLHVLQLIEAGIPVVMGLLLDVNALVILLMLLALLAHEATALWDSSYALRHRYIGALEQHVHSFLEVMPLMAVSFVTLLYWDQFQALMGMGTEPARFQVQLKPDPLSPGYLTVVFSAVTLFVLLPYGEELWRCMKVSRASEDAPRQSKTKQAA